MTTRSAGFISPRVAIGLVIVSALSMLAVLVLTAFAQDFRTGGSGGGNVISKSAVGFEGMRFLLDSTGSSVRVNRQPPVLDADSLVILTPEASSSAADLAKLSKPGPRLIILPKWSVMSDPLHSGWVIKLSTLDAGSVTAVLAKTVAGVSVAQRTDKSRPRLVGRYNRFLDLSGSEQLPVETLQTIDGKNLDPDIVDDKGKAVLSQIRGTETYILSDPDLFNNHALADPRIARFAIGLVQALRVRDTPVAFDVTLNGFGRTPDLLNALFEPPLLGATLCAILAAAFIAFHAMNRFGTPRQAGRVYAFGKRALADNTAAVIRMMHREPRMAPRYADAIFNQLMARMAATREAAANPAWLRRLEQRSDSELRFAQLSAEAQGARDTYDLMTVARKLYRWKRGITDGHR